MLPGLRNRKAQPSKLVRSRSKHLRRKGKHEKTNVVDAPIRLAPGRVLRMALHPLAIPSFFEIKESNGVRTLFEKNRIVGF
jgi:hypothetical protein